MNSKILIAVDFGTTYSGVAWSQTARPEIQTLITQWPDADGSIEGLTPDKIPTELSFDGTKWKWGTQIDDQESRYQWFKLELDPGQVGGVPSELRAYTDPRALSPTYQYSAEVLTQEYLSQLRKHTLRILRSKLGDGVVDTTSIEYVITVPAIWSDGAKDLTKSCAIEAGLGTNIHIISEPEAAAIYTLDTMDPHNLQVGDTFVLCDAGGGTIDLITYSVLELKPTLKLRETVPGAGHTCGSTYLNRIFRKYLEDTFSGDDGWESDTIEEATAHFENVTKRKFDGGNGKYLIPVRGLADNPEKSVKRSHFTILGSRLVELFEPVMANIKNLVIEQVLQSKSVKAVLLVGGFGQSVYLREVIKGAVGPEVQVLQPPQGWTAVVRGALIKGLAETAPETSRVQVKTRSARKAWGIVNSVPFKDTIHDSSKRYWYGYEGANYISTMNWFLLKQDDVDEMEPIANEFYIVQPVSDGPLGEISVQIYNFDQNSAPLYKTSDVYANAVLKADLNAISTTSIPTSVGKDGISYYKCDYQIKAAFFSAHIEWTLWYQNVCRGAVKAKFNVTAAEYFGASDPYDSY